MRNALVVVGIGALVLIAGAYLINAGLATPPGTGIMSSSTPAMKSTITLTSSAFANGASIPSKYTCDADNVSPPLSWSGIPEGTRALALLMDDPDVPKALKPDGVFDHWTLFDIAPEVSGTAEAGSAGVAGANGAGKNAYTGPCPPPQYEPSEHRYFFRLYALDTELGLRAGATKREVLSAMEGHILGEGELMGKYKRR